VPPAREFIRPLSSAARIRVVTKGRPIESYAVSLELLHDGRWTTIRLIDNAHEEHHMHRYNGTVKQPAEQFMSGGTREVLPQAINFLRDHWEAIVRAWKS
jgi:hypothetical protein